MPLCPSGISSWFYRVFPKMHHSHSSDIYNNKLLDDIGKSAKCVHLYYVASAHKESNIAMMCNQYSYIFPSVIPLYSCTFGCYFFRHCIMIVTPVVGCFFGALGTFSEPGTRIAVLKLQCRSLALKH